MASSEQYIHRLLPWGRADVGSVGLIRLNAEDANSSLSGLDVVVERGFQALLFHPKPGYGLSASFDCPFHKRLEIVPDLPNNLDAEDYFHLHHERMMKHWICVRCPVSAFVEAGHFAPLGSEGHQCLMPAIEARLEVQRDQEVCLVGGFCYWKELQDLPWELHQDFYEHYVSRNPPDLPQFRDRSVHLLWSILGEYHNDSDDFYEGLEVFSLMESISCEPMPQFWEEVSSDVARRCRIALFDFIYRLEDGNEDREKYYSLGRMLKEKKKRSERVMMGRKYFREIYRKKDEE